jgi:hypothetical protein
MSLITGVSTGVTLLSGNATGVSVTEHVYLIDYNFAAYTGSTDSATVTGVGALIAANTRSGKTYTLRGAVCAFPGVDSNLQNVYIGATTVSTDALTFNLTTVDRTTELTSSTATLNPVGLVVVVTVS